jgi:hypothetical protein
LRAANSVWTGPSKTVSLKPARNEFVAFQEIVETAKPIREVSAHFPGACGPERRPHRWRTCGCVQRIVRARAQNYHGLRTQFTQPRLVSRCSTAATSCTPGYFHSPFPTSTTILPIRRIRRCGSMCSSLPTATLRRRARYMGDIEISWKGTRDSVPVAVEVWDFPLPQKIKSRAIFGMAPCTRCRPMKSWRTTNWRASTVLASDLQHIGRI